MQASLPSTWTVPIGQLLRLPAPESPGGAARTGSSRFPQRLEGGLAPDLRLGSRLRHWGEVGLRTFVGRRPHTHTCQIRSGSKSLLPPAGKPRIVTAEPGRVTHPVIPLLPDSSQQPPFLPTALGPG